MEIRKTSGLLACAGLMALALLSGCGSKSSTTSIPSVATIFYGHSLLFRGYTSQSVALTMGYNGFGQLGQGNLVNLPVASVVQGTGPVTGGATGAEHTIVFGNTSTVKTWGYNLYGQLGNPAISTTGTTAFSSIPVTVHGFGTNVTVTDVAAGGFHSLAVAGNTAYSWGYNGYGQLGNNSFVNSNIPVKVLLDATNVPLGPVTKVAAGGNHSLALTALDPNPLSDGGGRVYAWGNNSFGPLGATPLSIANSLYSALPLLVQIPVDPLLDATLPEVATTKLQNLTHVAQIAAGGSTSYALLNDGVTVWAWGYNGLGQLGLDPLVATNVSRTIPVKINLDTFLKPNNLTVLKISAGADHVLALLSDGTVLAWGFNGFGQLGNNSIVNSHVPVLVLTGGGLGVGTGSTLTGVTDIIAFGNHSLAKIGNQWFGWGDNGFGQLGNPVSTTSIGYLLIPVKVQGY